MSTARVLCLRICASSLAAESVNWLTKPKILPVRFSAGSDVIAVMSAWNGTVLPPRLSRRSMISW